MNDFCLYKQRTAQNQNHCVIPSGLQYHDVPSSDMLSGFLITSDMVSKTSKVIVSPSVVVVYLYFDSERKKGEHVRYHQLFVAKYYTQRKK